MATLRMSRAAEDPWMHDWRGNVMPKGMTSKEAVPAEVTVEGAASADASAFSNLATQAS